MTDQDFTLRAGDDKTLTVTVTEEDGTTAVNITGATIAWYVKTAPDSTNALVTKTTSDGVSITDGANGVFTVTVEGVDTADLDPGLYFHGATVTLVGLVYTVMVGWLSLEPSVVGT